jgi:K+-sensing histidine kinase KdpD
MNPGRIEAKVRALTNTQRVLSTDGLVRPKTGIDGIGLGLPIARAFVEAPGGKVNIADRQGGLVCAP